MKFIKNAEVDFSVVIPVFNGRKTVKYAVESVLNQTCQPSEIIVVNDGSTDDTLKILEEYRDRIQIINQAHAGAAAARRIGTLKAQGSYVAYLDSDDVWANSWLETSKRVIDAYAITFFVCDFVREERGIVPSFSGVLNSEYFLGRLRSYGRLLCEKDHLYIINEKSSNGFILSGFPVFPSTTVIKKA